METYYKMNGKNILEAKLKAEGLNTQMLEMAHKRVNKMGFMTIVEYAQFYGYENGIEAIKELNKAY